MIDTQRGRLQPGGRKVVGGAVHRRPSPSSGQLAALALTGALVLLLVVVMLRMLRGLHSSWQAALGEEYGHGAELSSKAAGPYSVTAGAFGLFRPEVQRWSDSIVSWSEAAALPPQLVALVMQIESCGDPQAVSPAGAQGLFQVMPFHFGAGEDMLAPDRNAARGLAYLRQAYRLADGQIDRTLAGYNGGLSQIDLPPALWPEETRRYVHWGTGIWADLQSGAASSHTLDAWLDAGGERLCRAARDELALR